MFLLFRKIQQKSIA